MRRALFLAAPLVFAAGLAYADHTLYRVQLRTTPAPPTVGASTRVRVSVFAPGGLQVRRFDPLHGVAMHFIAVSQDLEDFAHVHPRASLTGTLSTSLTFSKAQPYTVFMEYDPAGSAAERTSRSAIRPAGAQPKPATLDASTAFDGTQNRIKRVAGTDFTLVGHPGANLRRGVPARLHLRVAAANGGALGLQDYLGMRAHAIVLSQDLATFQHLHGSPLSGGMVGGVHGGHGGAAGGDPNATSEELAFEATFPTAGLYKVFFQVQRSSTVITAPVVIRVAP
jgi:hypothetical protein